MKPCQGIVFALLLVVFSACTRLGDSSVETHRGTSLPNNISPELAAIDSLMWQRPDSALALLLPCFDTCRDAMLASPTDDADNALETHSMRLYDRHYANLLLAELLYKNDYAQANRTALQQAVAYFDSLADTPDAAFLAARAHYINGVGYYERDSIVEACREYLKTMEIMEERFGEKELVGKKARFMAYTYNRLGELFSAQFMMEPSIACYEQSLVFCKIAPTSRFGVSNTLMQLGKQYDKLGKEEKAGEYYAQALEALPTHQGPVYRDIVASKALCDYQLGSGMEQPIETLRRILTQAANDRECLTRCLTIGDIFFEEGLYDSAMVYLEPVFERNEDFTRKTLAAKYLRVIYDSLGYEDKSDACMRLLAEQKKSEGENKALVSQLESLFQTYLKQKQEQKVAQEKRKAVLRTVRILVPIAFAIAVVIKIRGRKRLAEQETEAQRELEEKARQHEAELKRQEEKAAKKLEAKDKQHKAELKRQQAKADKTLEETGRKHEEALEAEQQAHRMEQAALSGRLKRSNQELRELKDKIQQHEGYLPKLETPASSFVEEPVCRLIMERVHDGQFKSKMDCRVYEQYALDKQQLMDLRVAADRHYSQFTLRLRKAYPQLTNIDIDHCCLYLLNLTHAEVSALTQRAYNTVVERDSKIRKAIGSEKPLPVIMMDIALSKISI